MPWNIAQKKVIRENPDFTGETIWQQDQQATIKIIANRHDVHDQDLADSITQCLNINGVNEMLAILDMNGYRIDNVGDATVAEMAVNLGQLNQASVDMTSYVDTEIADLKTEVDLVSVTWLEGSNTIRLEKQSGVQLDAVVQDFNEIKSGGLIYHKSELFTGVSVLADITQQTRFTLINNSNMTVTFQRPTGADPYLGEDYCVEGSVLVTNGATPGTITINNDGGAVPGTNILGAQNTNPNEVMVLGYLIHRQAGDVYQEVYSWCT